MVNRDRSVVVKTIATDRASDPTSITRFRRAAMAAARLNHPNVAAVFDYGTDEERLFIVMEYVEGQNLAQILTAEGPLEADRAIGIACEVAAGLAVAHHQGFVHRDVKPSNILISTSGEAKVVDFGIAQVLDSESDLTEDGMVMGTATYVSPEQAQGLPLEASSDLYSLGVVLFEMVTGRPPFDGSNAAVVAHKHVTESLPSLAAQSSIPSDLGLIIERLLSKAPSERYRSALELRTDLSTLLDNPDHSIEGRVSDELRSSVLGPAETVRSSAGSRSEGLAPQDRQVSSGNSPGLSDTHLPQMTCPESYAVTWSMR